MRDITEFNTDSLRDKKSHSSFFIKIDDVHEFSDFLRRIMNKLEYSVQHHEINSVKHDDFKHVLKNESHHFFGTKTYGVKNVERRSVSSGLWKIFAGLSAGIFAYFVLFSVSSQYSLLRILFAGSALLSIITFFIRDRTPVSIWIKSYGVFDPEKGEGIAHAVISGDVKNEDTNSSYFLEETFNEIVDSVKNSFITVAGIAGLIKKPAQALDLSLVSASGDAELLNESISEGEDVSDKREVLNSRRASLDISKDLLELL